MRRHLSKTEFLPVVSKIAIFNQIVILILVFDIFLEIFGNLAVSSSFSMGTVLYRKTRNVTGAGATNEIIEIGVCTTQHSA